MTTNCKNNTKKETMTDKLAAKLSAAWSIDFQKGEKPWSRPWYSIGDGAKSYSTGHYYSLLNQVLLAFSGTGYRDGMEYATFNQIKQAGGKVKKGEHAAQVLLVTRWQPKDPETGKPATRKDPETGEEKPLILRHRRGFNLFSLDQCEGITPKWEGKKDPRKLDIATRNPEIDTMITDYCKREGIEFKEGGWKAYFRKANIEIRVPKFEDFTSQAEYYSTFFHEASHYADRIYLDSGKYVCLDWYRAACECVAECSCALIMRYLGIETEATNENSTAYINEWGEMVKEKPEIVLDIIARAERAARAVLGLTENPEPEPTEAEPEKQEQPEPEKTTEPAKTPVFIATKNKYCEPFPGETLPFKKIPAGALVKLAKAGLTRHEVEIFTGGLFYRAKVKNLYFLEESPAQVWPGLKPEKQPQPEPMKPQTPAPVVQVITANPANGTPRRVQIATQDAGQMCILLD